MSKLDCSTIFAEQFFQEINPLEYTGPAFFQGRPLNPPDEADSSFQGHKIVCVNEMFEDNDHNVFRVIDVLGNGTFSYVFKVQMMMQPTTFCALKIIKNLPQYRITGISEIMVHKILNEAPPHPGKDHIIMPLSTFETDGHVCMVLPLLHRSLFEGICQTQSTLDLLLSIRTIMKQLMEALCFIHMNGVIHCDLKPDNILFKGESTHNICLIDFGSATTSMCGQGQYIQSRFYRSPEVMLGLPYNSMIDIWSAGCVAAELYLDFAIFACECESDVVHTMAVLFGQFPENLLQISKNWWKFYDMTPRGFTLKMNPLEVLATRHSYHSIFEKKGPVTLNQLIFDHKPIVSPEEAQTVACFSDFVHRLLELDQRKRLTAEQALQHPFIIGNFQFEGWNPPPVSLPSFPANFPLNNQERPRPPSVPNSIDFLSLM
ncbi:CMGC family protein kinase [Tritrichomonas foetus]|uniref:CMGC family protein kinase n=1 Tax=Tritrichomonas foetus TaxID=1144522 RepID=A0A1J4JWG8_9EUKA|nr:CMGC family protein kinase [Tritrichomonas foetus]|eukprot:OHT01876.1 CMGC family protein kinase [Tritrichomonas foetus]